MRSVTANVITLVVVLGVMLDSSRSCWGVSALVPAACSVSFATVVVCAFWAAVATSAASTELDTLAPGLKTDWTLFDPICTCDSALYAGVWRLDTTYAAPTATTTATIRIQMRRRSTPT